MTNRRSLAAPFMCFCLLASAAVAAELTGAETKDFISGKTVYIETTAASVAGIAGKAVLYYGADGSVFYKTPMGALWHGTWTVKDNSVCANWKENPTVRCAKYDKQGDAINIVDSATGQLRAKIVKVAPGDSENLGP